MLSSLCQPIMEIYSKFFPLLSLLAQDSWEYNRPMELQCVMEVVHHWCHRIVWVKACISPSLGFFNTVMFNYHTPYWWAKKTPLSCYICMKVASV